MLDGAGGAAIAGLAAAEVATDLTRGEGDALGPQGLGELAGGPGPVLAEQVAEQRRDTVAPGAVGGRAGAAGVECRPPAPLLRTASW